MNGVNKANIVIVEDNEEVRKGLIFLIDSYVGFNLKGSYNQAETAIQNITVDNPQVVLMDIELPKMSGLQAIKEIKKKSPSTQILVISVHESNEIVFEALCAGAVGYLTKVSTYDKLISSIEEILKGGSPMSTQIARMVVSSFNKNQRSPLSQRETEILELLASGKSHSRIAEELFLSKETIRTHMRNIYSKLHVNSKADAIAKAKSDKLI